MEILQKMSIVGVSGLTDGHAQQTSRETQRVKDPHPDSGDANAAPGGG